MRSVAEVCPDIEDGEVRMMSVRSQQAVSVMFPERPVSFSKWQQRFRRSSAVHFFSKNTFDLKVVICQSISRGGK